MGKCSVFKQFVFLTFLTSLDRFKWKIIIKSPGLFFCPKLGYPFVRILDIYSQRLKSECSNFGQIE